MTNRQRAIRAIETHASRRLREEIEYYLDTYPDTDGYDKADALNDAMTFAESSDDRSMVRDCIDVLIAAGFYQPRRGEVVTMGRDRSPTRGGVKYDCVSSWHEWIRA